MLSLLILFPADVCTAALATQAYKLQADLMFEE